AASNNVPSGTSGLILLAANPAAKCPASIRRFRISAAHAVVVCGPSDLHANKISSDDNCTARSLPSFGHGKNSRGVLHRVDRRDKDEAECGRLQSSQPPRDRFRQFFKPRNFGSKPASPFSGQTVRLLVA